MAEHGCYHGMINKKHTNRECNTGKGAGKEETPLPESFKPLNITPAMDKAWEDLIKSHLSIKE